LIKECEYYKNEVKENQAKLEEMASAGRDPYDVKKFREVLGESEMMVPDSTKRMLRSIEDLRAFVRERAGEEEEMEGGGEGGRSLRDSEWYEAAAQILDGHPPPTGATTSSGGAARGEGQQDHRVETNVSDLAEGEIF
jgi:tubulin-specific chaperone A